MRRRRAPDRRAGRLRGWRSANAAAPPSPSRCCSAGRRSRWPVAVAAPARRVAWPSRGGPRARAVAEASGSMAERRAARAQGGGHPGRAGRRPAGAAAVVGIGLNVSLDPRTSCRSPTATSLGVAGVARPRPHVAPAARAGCPRRAGTTRGAGAAATRPGLLAAYRAMCHAVGPRGAGPDLPRRGPRGQGGRGGRRRGARSSTRRPRRDRAQRRRRRARASAGRPARAMMTRGDPTEAAERGRARRRLDAHARQGAARCRPSAADRLGPRAAASSSTTPDRSEASATAARRDRRRRGRAVVVLVGGAGRSCAG